MVYKLNEMEGKEFINKILEGEKDFSGIKLKYGFDLSSYEAFEELNSYL